MNETCKKNFRRKNNQIEKQNQDTIIIYDEEIRGHLYRKCCSQMNTKKDIDLFYIQITQIRQQPQHQQHYQICIYVNRDQIHGHQVMKNYHRH